MQYHLQYLDRSFNRFKILIPGKNLPSHLWSWATTELGNNKLNNSKQRNASRETLSWATLSRATPGQEVQSGITIPKISNLIGSHPSKAGLALAYAKLPECMILISNWCLWWVWLPKKACGHLDEIRKIKSDLETKQGPNLEALCQFTTKILAHWLFSNVFYHFAYFHIFSRSGIPI